MYVCVCVCVRARVLFLPFLSCCYNGKSVIKIDSSFCGEFKTIVMAQAHWHTLSLFLHIQFSLDGGNVTLLSSESRAKG